MIYKEIDSLIKYGLRKNLLSEEDISYVRNRLLKTLRLEDYEATEIDEDEVELSEILDRILDFAIENKLIEDGITERDLFDTEIMDCLLARPSEIIRKFNELYEQSPQQATDWYYEYSKATNYIRTDRIARDLKWRATSEYGDLDITINLSKPEKDPKDIARARLTKSSAYPKCLLCRENEGFSGNLLKPARENHRIIPIKLAGEDYFLQYSPYVYYNEHCIVLNKEHRPMKIDRQVFVKLFEFIEQFPHYTIGSNADLPIVGGSILSHDHFQGGRYEFPMARANIRRKIEFASFEDVEAGILDWPMSVIRIKSEDYTRLVDLADKILNKFRQYSDESLEILAMTNGEPHNTITPIARKRAVFELDLVLRNNRTNSEHELGIFHPHKKLHHIKKENIGLIEVMGLAVLPGRLKKELDRLSEAMILQKDLSKDGELVKHFEWAADILKRNKNFNKDNAKEILKNEVGIVFSKVLEDASIYKNDIEGQRGILRFIDYVNGNEVE